MMSVATTSAPLAPPVDSFDAEVLEMARRLAGGGSFLRHPLRMAHRQGMELVSRDLSLRAALFRMVDVAPACEGPSELSEHLAALLEQVEPRSAAVALVDRAASSFGVRRFTGSLVARAIHRVARRFIIGETPAEAARVLRGLWARGMAASVDLL